MKFTFEIKKTSQRKTASLDQVYQIVLETDNPELLELGKLAADVTIDADISITDSSKIWANEDE